MKAPLAPKFTIGGSPEAIQFKPKAPGSRKDPTEDDIFSIDTYLIPNVLKATRRLVIIESPYSNDDLTMVNRHTLYAKQCLKDSFKRGEAPFSSHILYSDALNYRVRIDKDIGLISHVSWIAVCDLVAVYVDFGLSEGMQLAVNVAKIKHKRIEYRTIGQIS